MCSKEQEMFQENGPPQDMGKDLRGCWALPVGAGEGTELPKVLAQSSY